MRARVAYCARGIYIHVDFMHATILSVCGNVAMQGAKGCGWMLSNDVRSHTCIYVYIVCLDVCVHRR